MSAPVARRRARRRLTSRSAALIGGAVALGAGGAALASAPAGAAAARAPVAHPATAACLTARLSVAVVNRPDGAAGTIFYPLRFTNRGTAPCTLRGYPGVSAVTRAGRQIGAAARRGTGASLRTVTLAPGHSASATVGVVEVGNFPASRCRAVTAAGLRVFPPDQTASRIAAFRFRTCSLTSAASLSVLPVR